APAPAPAPAVLVEPVQPDDTPAWEDAPVQEAPQHNVAPPPIVVPEPAEPSAPSPAAQQSQTVPDDAAFETLHPQEFETLHEQGFESMDEGRYEPVDMGDPDFEMLDGSLEATPALAAAVFAPERKKTKSPRLRNMTAQAWPALAATLPVTGLAAELARQSEWLGLQGEQINLRVAIRTLAESPGKARLCTVLSEHFGTVVQLSVEYGATGDETAHAVEQAQKVVRQQEAEQAVATDPLVLTLISEFGAQVVPGSISAVPLSRAA
uniref:DNA polymerase III subunit gamma/tau C-terminal domain-containing protein n=1 Tax=Pollutimonas bauzanensis TaxID=658167 RepID=UPI00334071FB